jgi:ASC-1-like (ASCH) protein
MMHYLKHKLEPIEAITKGNIDRVMTEIPMLEALMLASTSSRHQKYQQDNSTNDPPPSMTGKIWKYSIRIKQKYYEFITSGLKDIECRLNRGYFQKFRVGDSLCFTYFKSKQWVTITARHVFPDVQTALHHLSLDRVLPNCVSIDEAVKEYNTFPNYKHYLSQQNPEALVAFEFRLIADPNKVPHQQPSDENKTDTTALSPPLPQLVRYTNCSPCHHIKQSLTSFISHS